MYKRQKEDSRKSVRIKELIDRCASSTSPKWLEVDREAVKATVKEPVSYTHLDVYKRQTLCKNR